MGMASPAGGSGPRPNVNITPLVDVALVVLIIFMVVAPMLTKTFSLSLPPEPKETPAEPQTDEPIVLTIDESGAIELNRVPVSEGELASAIPDRLSRARNKVVHFDAADALPYGRVLDVVDACRAAGADSIAIVTKKLPRD
ncbi:MAG: biopolymer transporter ExbD [Polyangiaceae bacterium]|jgi:biopolymer transport protein ExbD|nr:biopolymer transporter ExbD [Polyangiaceae bacterium]